MDNVVILWYNYIKSFVFLIKKKFMEKFVYERRQKTKKH